MVEDTPLTHLPTRLERRFTDPRISLITQDEAREKIERRINSHRFRQLVHVEPNADSYVLAEPTEDHIHTGYEVIGVSSAHQFAVEVMQEFGYDGEFFTPRPDTRPEPGIVRRVLDFPSRTIPGLVFTSWKDYEIDGNGIAGKALGMTLSVDFHPYLAASKPSPGTFRVPRKAA